MDDGSWCGKGYHLNTNGFKLDQVLFLAKIIASKYNLNCSLHSRNRIYIWASSVPSFISIIKPHIVPSMLYKITPAASGG
jgi:LAGLIDADG DNA endonuclease family